MTGQNGMLVFVYGTLKRGHGNHHWLAGARFAGEAVLPGAVLHDLGPFPMAVPGEGRIHGEVYAVDGGILAALDCLEGCPRLYQREQRALADGRPAWVYLGRARQVRHVPPIGSGRWP
ncbi:MAG: gamma-glutamylcyclotransferase family protein [Synechococcaceae cyanobacterium]|nr:gamma-glutamylcyclotransferase family protein [Synechococcaceae cyanobacterium]